MSEMLEKYKNAVLTEMMYIKNSGGRKYRVTNGRFINRSNGGYVYSFESESELHLSDDAPVTLTIADNKATGIVLLCEGFQILISIDNNLGNTIGQAYINVEPWKLLEALHNKLSLINPNNRIAKKLINLGPELATKEPPSKIPKGQEFAIKKCFDDDITIIWGPPGTGKTYTMARVAIQAIKQNQSILIVSHSNISVDGVIKAIAKQLKDTGNDEYLKAGKILRYGYVRDDELAKDTNTVAYNYALKKVPELKKALEKLTAEKTKIINRNPYSEERSKVEKELKELRIRIRQEEKKYASRANIIATTISKVTVDKIFDEKTYDIVMFDEVSMAYIPQIICAASYADSHFICVGDFRQLAPIAQSEAKNELKRDIFSYLGIFASKNIYYHPWLVMLDEQRRMHPDISDFSNLYAYRNLLKNHSSVECERDSIVKLPPIPGHAMSMIDLLGTYCAAGKNSNNSRFNLLSAIISFSSAITSEKNGEKSIGIITPYKAQTQLIRAFIQDKREKEKTDVSCATVHQFQGSERDVIVFDAVESYPFSTAGWLMKKESNLVLRLINVAVTRARGKFIAIADSRFWLNKFEGTNNATYRLVCYMIEHGHVIKHSKEKQLEEYLTKLYAGPNIRFYRNFEELSEILSKDIATATEKIVISIPDGKLDETTQNSVYKMLISARQNGIRILCKCNNYHELPNKWKALTWETENATFPIIMVDDRLAWYGLPISRGRFVDGNSSYSTVCPIQIRIVGKHSMEIIKSLCEIETREVDGMTKALLEKKDMPNDTGKEESGLGKYIEKNYKCTKCEAPLYLTRGRSGKCYLQCKKCKNMEYLTPEVTNRYIQLNNITCPIHHSDIRAGLSKYGIYIKCSRGHFMKPDEI